jgi:nucleoside-diphosphate-sugar epimerase
MKRVLITGAAGFLGSFLCDKFLKKGYYVVGMDNFLTGSEDNISHLSPDPNFRFIEQDVTEKISIPGVFDLVLHFACPASPIDYMKLPLETMEADSIGTFNTLEFARSRGARYVFASSSEVYGDPEIPLQNENYWGNVNPIGPRSVYDEAKRFSEALSMSYFREFELDVRLIRIFNTYGPRMKLNDGRVVPNFIYQALKGDDLTVYGDGSQTRSFCYVNDLVDGIFMISMKEDLNGEVLNLGNPDEYKIIDFAQIIIDKIDSDSGIIFRPLPENDPHKRCPDITKVKGLVGWEPKTSLDRGLKDTIDFFRLKMS